MEKLSKKATLLSCMFVVAILARVAHAQEPRQNLFGDPFGARADAADHGVEVESILTMDYVAGVGGGVETSDTVLGNYDLTATIDTKKLGLWEGGKVFTYVLGNFNTGSVPTELVGDLQASDNIETDEAIKLYEAWYEHSFAQDSFGLLFGLHDYNSEFYALDYAGGLINSSFGVGPDVSQIGPSIFATTALAARLRYSFSECGYLLAAVYDGIAGSPTNPRGTHIHLGGDDGLFYAAELGLLSDESSHYKLSIGGWYHTAKYEDFSEKVRDDNVGLYIIGEKQIFAEVDQAQGLGIFAQLGNARQSRNLLDTYIGGGLSYTGLIPSRNEDVASVGIAKAFVSGDAMRSDETLDSAETAFEVNYRVLLVPYLALTPDFQWISSPGAVIGAKDATVLALRAEIAM